MNALKRLVIAGLITAAGAIALPGIALAGQDYGQSGFTHGPDYYAHQMEQYHDQIAHMTPDERTKLTTMQDKLMQMEMDQASANMKMEMEMAKAKRDIDMYIASTQRGQR